MAKKRKLKTPYKNQKVIRVRKVRGGAINRLTLACGHTFDKADPIDLPLPIPKRHKCYKCQLNMKPEHKPQKKGEGDAKTPRPKWGAR